MEGYYSEPVKIGILQGKLVQPVHGDKPYQTIATDDIGGFVAAAFERPKDFLGLELEIAGSELTNLEAAEVFSRVLGRPVEFVEMPIPPDKEYSQMFNWFNDAGFQADIGLYATDIPSAGYRRLSNGSITRAGTKRVRRIVPPKD